MKDTIYKYNYSFSERFQKLISCDKIRIGKILEIFQYTIISYILVILLVSFLNKFIFNQTKELIDELSTKHLFIRIFFELFFLIIILFYLRKVILLFPSLPALYITGFQEQTVMDYVMHIVLIFFFIEIITNIKYRMEIIHDRLEKYYSKKNKKNI